MSRVLCTGSRGFIGTHLMEALENAGHATGGLDNAYNFERKGRFYGTDITVAKNVLADFDHFLPEVVIHAAALASVRDGMVDPDKYLRTNIYGTLNVIHACVKTGVKQLIFISSGGTVYGQPTELPVPVTHECKPMDVYGLTKLAGEHLVRIMGDFYGFHWACLRYPNVYGPGQPFDGEAGVVAIFAHKMLNGKQPVVNGTGLQTRDFMYVADVVRATIETMDAADGVYNVGTGVETSVLDIYNALADITGYAAPPGFAPAKKGEVDRIALAPSWPMARMTLEHGLKLTVESLR